MTVKEIFELRKQGRVEEAYEAAREVYANDKGTYASVAMFWTATDMLKMCQHQRRDAEAQKILKALERMLPQVPDQEGTVKRAFERCEQMVSRENQRRISSLTQPEHLKIGAWGEELACAYLSEKGYCILERDWHSGHRDIDIIAQKGDVVVFIEVKTRRNADFGLPEEAVDYRKRRNLRLAMNHYVKYRHLDNPIRFDIVSIIGQPGEGNPAIDHLEDINIQD